MANKKEKLVIIDSHALLHRAWHAVPPLHNKEGLMVNAVFGFSSLILNIIKETKPDYMLAAFDLAEETFRHKKTETYKAQRVKQADEFYQQIPLAEDVLATFKIPVLSKGGFEADDVLGSIAKEVYEKHKNIEVYIVTGDLDALQLVNDRVKVVTLKKGFNEIMIYDPQAVRERFNLEPKQIIDLKALMGDSSDNIKGVKGIGQKGASDLIREFGSVENIYQNIDSPKIKDRTRELLKADHQAALDSKELVTIVNDLKLDWNLEQAKFGDFDAEEVYQIFQKLEFNSLLNKIPLKQAIQQHQTINTAKEKYQKIKEKKSFDQFLKILAQQKIFAIDSETTGLDVLQEKIIGLSFSWQAEEAYFVQLENEDFQKYALEKLKPILENEKIAKVGHNLKFDYKVLKVLNISLRGIAFDTMLAAYLSNPDRGLKLEELAFAYLGYKKLKLADLLPEEEKSRKKEIKISEIPEEKLAWYAAEDADITWRLYQKLLPESQEKKNYELLIKMEIPLIPILAEMELKGIILDIPFLKKMEKEFAQELKKLTKKIYQIAGQEFNIASPLQLKEILFEKLAIQSKGIKKTKTGLSTAASELEKMKKEHPIIPLIIEFRELSKLQSTYIKALPELVNPKDKRIHTSYNQTITATGRLSSSDPNLQNIPIRTELGRKIRQAFVAPKGYLLLAADYSQIELRLAAAISKDPKMTESFLNGEDIHARTAAEIHNIDLKDVTKDIRRTAKEVNFGVLYGLGSLGLSQRTDMNRQEAKNFIEKYFTIYKKIKDYIEKTKKFAHQYGYAQTIFGRRRYLPEINSSMPMLVASAERMAINMPLQGTAADLLKLAMIKISRDLPKISKDSKMVLQVHDELVLEVPEAEAKKVAKFIKKTMEEVYRLSVPLVVDLELGKNWNSLEKI
ncbi:DNA polymerase I [Candidatus Nomurabacteria bacterium]|nr:DNA polymerase I [Candidatus Nomurabacteria bacterium]